MHSIVNSVVQKCMSIQLFFFSDVLDPDWQHTRDTLSYIGLATSIIAIILIADAACYLVWHNIGEQR